MADGPGSHPAYLSLLASGEIDRRVERAREIMRSCVLCGRRCRADRLRGVAGAACGTGERAVVSAYHPHHGEEEVLRGSRGSGTIFFGSCNLRCQYCQNWEISQSALGREVAPVEIAEMMLDLERRGCHNVNLVSPSHQVAQILAAVAIAARRGLTLPLVYNTGGYDSPEGLGLLEDVIDIYMPDMKYGDSAAGRLYSRVRDYASVNRAAVREMHRQVGDLVLDERGIARRGLLVRHLVLPAGVANSGRVFRFLAEEISPDTYVNLMDQYHPAYRAGRTPPLDRRITRQEFERALGLAEKYGLRRVNPKTAPAPRMAEVVWLADRRSRGDGGGRFRNRDRRIGGDHDPEPQGRRSTS